MAQRAAQTGVSEAAAVRETSGSGVELEDEFSFKALDQSISPGERAGGGVGGRGSGRGTCDAAGGGRSSWCASSGGCSTATHTPHWAAGEGWRSWTGILKHDSFIVINMISIVLRRS